MDVPAGVTQEEGHTGFLIHLLSGVHALIFLARRIQPFLSLVDREFEFCILRRPTLMHTKNLYENGSNLFVFFGTKNMSEGHLMHTVLVCYVFDKLGQACLCR